MAAELLLPQETVRGIFIMREHLIQRLPFTERGHGQRGEPLPEGAHSYLVTDCVQIWLLHLRAEVLPTMEHLADRGHGYRHSGQESILFIAPVAFLEAAGVTQRHILFQQCPPRR